MEQGRWTENTRPTLDEVTRLIELACDEVTATFEGRSPCSEATRAAARAAAIYSAAETIEISYNPESNGDGSAVTALGEKLRRLTASASSMVIARCPLDPDDPGDDGGSLAPAGRGRDPRYPVMGLSTRW